MIRRETDSAILIGLLLAIGLTIGGESRAQEGFDAVPPAFGRSSEKGVIEFLERRVQSDPLDFVAYNKLASCYLRLSSSRGTNSNSASMRPRPLATPSINIRSTRAVCSEEYCSWNSFLISRRSLQGF